MSSEDTLREQMLERMKSYQKYSYSSGNKGKFFSPPEGRSLLRILPPVGEMDKFLPYQPVGVHGGKINLRCPKVALEDPDAPCPFCELNEFFFKAGDKETAKRYWVQVRGIANILVRDDSELGYSYYIWQIPYTVEGNLMEVIGDAAWGPKVLDVYEGHDFMLTRKGKGRDTRYPAFQARPEPTPLIAKDDGSPDEEAIAAFLEGVQDLSYMRKPISWDDLVEKGELADIINELGGN